MGVDHRGRRKGQVPRIWSRGR